MTESHINNNKSLSIRITPNGLSFCVYAPHLPQPFEYRECDIQHTISIAANLKHALTHDPMLCGTEYQRVNVLVTTPEFTVVPVADFQAAEVQTLFDYVFPKSDPQRVTYNVLRRSGLAVIFGIDRNVYQLIIDDYPNARFYASSATLVEFLAEKSRSEHSVFAYLHEREMTLYAFERGRLLMANQYPASNVSDCQYYLLNVWQQMGFNQLEDEVCIVGDSGKEQELNDKLTNFVRNVRLIDRTEDFYGRLTEGCNNIPYDLQTLLICGF